MSRSTSVAVTGLTAAAATAATGWVLTATGCTSVTSS